MKILFRILAILLITASVFSCNNKDLNTVSEKDVLLDSITIFEKDLHSDIILNQDKAVKMIKLYLEYSDQYKTDSLAPEYLFRAAEIAMNSDKPIDACSYLFRIEKKYNGQFDKMPAVIYMLGYVHENMLNDFDNAEAYYNKFLKEYPDNPRAEEVKLVISHLRMSDEELIRQFEKQNIAN
jgi:tetratricopeptide (TPR) repeat protein